MTQGKMRSRTWLAVLLVFMLGAAACGGNDDTADAGETTTTGTDDDTATQPEVDSLVFSGVTPNAGNWPIQIGVEFGLFEEYGLSVEMIFSESSPAAMAALIGGSVQFTSTVYDSVVLANEQEENIALVAEGYRFAPFDLIVGKDVTSFDDLEGSTCGAQNPVGVGDALYVQSMMEHGGDLAHPDDYEITNVKLEGGTSLGALESGQVKCIAQLPPISALLQDEGFNSLYQLEQVPQWDGLSFFGIVGMTNWMEDNPVATEAFLKGYLHSIAYLYDPSNREAAVDLLAENADLDAETANAAYVWAERGGYPRDGLIAADVLPRHVELMIGAETVEPDFVPNDFVDLSFVQEAWEALPEEIQDGPGPDGLLPADKQSA